MKKPGFWPGWGLNTTPLREKMFRNLNMAIVAIPAGHCNFLNMFWALAQKKACAYFGTFWQETFWHRHFIAINISALGHFVSMDVWARRLFHTAGWNTIFSHIYLLERLKCGNMSFS
jgi:hypothetical protein